MTDAEKIAFLEAQLSRLSNPWTVEIKNHRTGSWSEFYVGAPVTLDQAEKYIAEVIADNPQAELRAAPWLNMSQVQEYVHREELETLKARNLELLSAGGLSLDPQTQKWLAEGGDMVTSADTPAQALTNLLRVLGEQWQHLEEMRKVLEARNRELEAERDAALKSAKFQKEFAWSLGHPVKAPCGHCSSLCYSEDGGKNIRCLLCSESALRSLADQQGQDTKRLDKLQRILRSLQYHEDLSFMSDVEDGVWVARLFRHEQGMMASSLDPSSAKTEDVRSAIDAANEDKYAIAAINPPEEPPTKKEGA